MQADRHREAGAALLMVMLVLSLLSAISAAVLLTSSSELAIAAHFRDAHSGRYAAESIAARALDEIAAIDDWSAVASGLVRSPFADGSPAGTRTLDDGSVVDLTQAGNLANCEKITACSASDTAAVSRKRPWGSANPRWQPFAWGRLRDLADEAAAVPPPWYLLLFVGSDPAEMRNRLVLRAEAFGPRGAHTVIELAVGRPEAAEGGSSPGAGAPIRVLSSREVR